MKKEIKKIWIESEIKGPIIGGTLETNDNSDVIITFSDDTQFIATFFTYENIEMLRKKNKNTGECLNGKYFWASNMLLVDKINRKEVEEIVNHLITENEFENTFEKIIIN
ncbi:hypothetical protein [Flavobacterium sp.]|uniref:hypothetical protein n=1 Tax=Flavobacterium sp. TaxID=239 RepID=UPI00404829CB